MKAAASDCAERTRGDHETEYHTQPDARRVHDEFLRPFPPACDDALAHPGGRYLPDRPPHGCRSDDCDTPACRARHGGNPDESEQRYSERHDDVTERAEDGAVGEEENKSTERGECNTDTDAGESALPRETPLQVDDATGNDAPATWLVVARGRG